MTNIEYGRCPCGGIFDGRTVEIRLSKPDRAIVVENVPQGACPQCGSRVYKTEVLECIESIVGSNSSSGSFQH
jgi:YgiT-type zinc finger domain-containing protein